MKTRELRELSTEELQTRLNDSFQELFNLRFQRATRQLENSERIGEVKRDIARIKTLMRERELAGVA